MGYTFFAVFPYEPTKKAFHCLGQNLVNEMCQQLYEIQEKILSNLRCFITIPSSDSVYWGLIFW